MLKAIDLFAGIGGIRFGFEQAFDGDIETVFASDIDRYAQKTYAANFDTPVDDDGNVTICGDIRSVDAADIPDFDICLAGFPCQAFSRAGRQLGFDDDYKGLSRGTLFFEVARIVEAKRPSVVFCENVKGLTSHDRGRTFKIICGRLEQLGYKVFSKVVMFTTIDDAWREHLREMDDLRQSVQNATYEQKDPLLIYKFESFGLFSKMLIRVNREVLSILNRSYIPVRDSASEAAAQRQQQQRERAKVDVNRLQASRMQAAAQAGQGEKQKPMPIHVEKKVGRNDPCPCGSGKKYKNCHGKGL